MNSTKLLIITQKVDERDQLLGFFIPWIERFVQKFERVTILCLEQGSASLPKNVHVISLGKDRGASKFSQLISFYRFIITRRQDYQIVFVHMNPIWVNVGALVWHILRKRIFFWYTHKAVTPKLRLAALLADEIFTASPESFRLSSRKVIVTGHGIDTDLFIPNPNWIGEPYSLLTVGRIAPVKNYEVLIEAVKLLNDSRIRVTVVGEAALTKDKEYEQKLHHLIDERGLSSQFIFRGKIINPNLVQIYQTHSTFVHMSKTGSIDKALLEAMACGMKVVSSNDAAQAFLPVQSIFSENNPQDLADKIKLAAHESASPQLRDYVVRYHNLNNLIETISLRMQS